MSDDNDYDKEHFDGTGAVPVTIPLFHGSKASCFGGWGSRRGEQQLK